MKLRSIAAAAAVAAAVTGSAIPASAHVRPHHLFTVVVSIQDSATGVLTTAAPLTVGEKLSLIGVGTGTFTVTSVTPAGSVDKVTLSPALSAQFHDTTVDFKVVSH